MINSLQCIIGQFQAQFYHIDFSGWAGDHLELDTSSKILVNMTTKMVAVWRVLLLFVFFCFYLVLVLFDLINETSHNLINLTSFLRFTSYTCHFMEM